MRKHWLRGLLLGVSMALLLAGGVALAAGVYIRVDQPCFECWEAPDQVQGNPFVLPPDEHVVQLTIGGWPPDDEVCWQISDPVTEYWDKWCTDGGEFHDPCHIWLFVTCDGLMGFWGSDCFTNNVVPANGIPSHYGEWLAQVYHDQEDTEKGREQITFLFAEDCEEAMREEFVPEPGTMVLLGSGLAGLAGYATLRWRTRE